MSVRGGSNHYLINKILARHWFQQGRQTGLGEAAVQDIIAEVVERTESVIDVANNGLPPSFPAAVADAILSGLKKQSGKLAALMTYGTPPPPRAARA